MKNKWLVLLVALSLIGNIWAAVNITLNNRDKDEIIGGLIHLALTDNEIQKDISELKFLNGAGEFENYYPEDEVWWYKIQCALTDPNIVMVSLSGDGVFTPFDVDETVYLKDYDDLVLDSNGDDRSAHWISGGLVNGAILSLTPGTYYHYGNSGLLYVTESDIENIDYDPVERYYRRVRYVLETKPDIEVSFSGTADMYKEIKQLNIPDEGAVISFVTGGSGFVAANLYLKNGDEWRTVNGMGPGIYLPSSKQFASAGNIYITPLNMVPIPGRDYDAGVHVVMNSEGRVYMKIHYLPDWW